MRKIIIAIVAIFLLIDLIPITVVIIMGKTMQEILSVCGLLLLAGLWGILFAIAIAYIYTWILD